MQALHTSTNFYKKQNSAENKTAMEHLQGFLRIWTKYSQVEYTKKNSNFKNMSF